jgi:hypothetical protein
MGLFGRGRTHVQAGKARRSWGEWRGRMDRAIRRSLQMPPKHHEESRKPRQSKAEQAAEELIRVSGSIYCVRTII